jgi:hypothetical protein
MRACGKAENQRSEVCVSSEQRGGLDTDILGRKDDFIFQKNIVIEL